MKRVWSWATAIAVAGLVLIVPARLSAQESARTRVISANPFGLLLELFNAEFEQKASGSTTAGVGGSLFTESGDHYVNADVFYRYYPSGTPMDGWAFGAKLGVTSVTEAGTYIGYGFDVNHSWLLGQEKRFYVGLGFGLKRLVGVGDNYGGLKYIPTFRIVNIGFAF